MFPSVTLANTNISTASTSAITSNVVYSLWCKLLIHCIYEQEITNCYYRCTGQSQCWQFTQQLISHPVTYHPMLITLLLQLNGYMFDSGEYLDTLALLESLQSSDINTQSQIMCCAFCSSIPTSQSLLSYKHVQHLTTGSHHGINGPNGLK